MRCEVGVSEMFLLHLNVENFNGKKTLQDRTPANDIGEATSS
jgi:hypothetical protein